MIKKALLLTITTFLLLSHFQDLTAQRKRQVRKTPRIVGAVTVKAAPEPKVDESKLNEQQKLRLESFRVVWQTINDYYYDDKFNGLNWRKLKYENEVKVIAAADDQQFYKILNELIARLNSSHFEIIPPEYLKEIDNFKETAAKSQADKESENEDSESDDEEISEDEINDIIKSLEDYNSRFGIGAELQMFGDDLLITHIDINSAAEKNGLKLGYKIEKVNGIDLAEFIQRFKKLENYEKSLKKEIPLYVKTFLFNGEKDSTVSIVYNDGKSPSREIVIPREKLEGELIYIGDHLPRQFLEFETRNIKEDIGYIRFNMFTVNSAEKFCQAISDFKDKKSLIIDLRGNRGGVIGAVYGIGGLLIEQTILAGKATTRRGEEIMAISPHLKNFKGRIAVLTNNFSYSSAEILASALKETKRATIIGEKTGGEALASLSRVLPNGAYFQYPVSNFKSFKGNVIEGVGVTPDIKIVLDRNSLVNGIDIQLDEAVKFVQKPVVKPKTIGEVTVKTNTKAPPPPAPAPKTIKKNEAKSDYDVKSVEVIENYINKIGGTEALKNLKSISGYGLATINRDGATLTGEVKSVKKLPNKSSEVFNFTGIGEIVETFDGEKYFVQSQVAGVEEYKSEQKIAELKLENDFLELVNLKENYSQVKFLGSFDRSGEQVNLIDVKTKDGYGFVLAFDVKTGFLVNRSGSATEVAYEDYRKTGNYFLPFKVMKENIVTLEFDEIEINTEIEETNFEKKLSCFDKID